MAPVPPETEGTIFSMTDEKGGGDGLYCSEAPEEEEVVGTAADCEERRNEDWGTGWEITDPKNEMFAIHLDERRGSNVRPEPDQYLQIGVY